MPKKTSENQEDIHFRIMRILQENPDINQRELARILGISLGGLNFCLRALIEKGFVKLENFHNSRHKFKYAYILTPAGLAHKVKLTGQFLKRKREEYGMLKLEIDSLMAESNQDSGQETQYWRNLN